MKEWTSILYFLGEENLRLPEDIFNIEETVFKAKLQFWCCQEEQKPKSKAIRRGISDKLPLILRRHTNGKL